MSPSPATDHSAKDKSPPTDSEGISGNPVIVEADLKSNKSENSSVEITKESEMETTEVESESVNISDEGVDKNMDAEEILEENNKSKSIDGKDDLDSEIKDTDRSKESSEAIKDVTEAERDIHMDEKELEEEKDAVLDSILDEDDSIPVNDNEIERREEHAADTTFPTAESAEEKQQAEKAQEAYLKQDAELEAYLESLKPKPKRKSVKEMLLSMPGFKDILSLKPKIGGGFEKKEVIFLDDESVKKETAKEAKCREQIEALKERFVRHAITAPPKTPKDHVKLKIKKKEEDSQGLEHLVEDEVEYIRNPLNAEEEAMNFVATPLSLSFSPKSSGTNRVRIRDMLLSKIRAQKKIDHERRVKINAMDNEEVEDGEEPEEELEDEDDSSSEDSELGEEEEEEDMEALLGGSKEKKSKDKCKYVDDEAEDEDGSSDEDDESTDDDSGEENNTAEGTKSIKKTDKDKEDELAGKATENRDWSLEDEVKQDSNSDGLDSANRNIIDVAASPGVAYFPKETGWNGSKEITEKDALWSPLLRVFQKNPRVDEPIEDFTKASGTVPKSLAKVITETSENFGNLADLCSGKFVTQMDSVSQEEEDEYAGFDDDDDVVPGIESKNETEVPADADVVKTPTAALTSLPIRMAVDGITPKGSEKISKTRLLMQFEEEAEKEAAQEKDASYEMGDSQKAQDADSEEDEEDITSTRTRVLRKKKRLQFSDDEDDDADKPRNEDDLSQESENENDLENEEELSGEEEIEELTPVEPVKSNPFFNKHGRLKRKFVDDEAELSGSDEGSADEDEKGLNHYEEEEGDEDEIDEDQNRIQVERAHLKHVIDDDERMIKYLQNKHLQAGDLHMDNKRERKFRWINADALDDDAIMGDSDDDLQLDENPEESEKKKEWIDKRKWLSENSHLLESDLDESQSLFTNSRFLKIGRNTLKRIESFADTSTSDSKEGIVIKESSNQRRSIYEEIIKVKTESKKSLTTLSSMSEGMFLESSGDSRSKPNTNAVNADADNKSMSEPFLGLDLPWPKQEKNVSSVGTKKGSFLSRGGMMLAKLAETTKPGDTVSNVKNNSRNFVFSHITPPNPDKTDGSNSRVKRISNVNKAGCSVQAKKPKIDRSFNILDERSKGSIFKHFSN